MKREFMITLEEIVKIPDYRERPLFSDGTIDTIKETKGYVRIEDDEISYIDISDVRILNQYTSKYEIETEFIENDKGIINKIAKYLKDKI